MGMMRIFIPVTNKILPLVMEGFIILDWVSVVSLIISTVISGGIGYFFKRKFEKDRRKFEEDRDKLKREFEKDLLSIKTNFEKEIYTYKARYDHKVEMMKKMLKFADRLSRAVGGMCSALYGEIEDFLTARTEFADECKKCEAFFFNHRPFVKKKVIENFGCFCTVVKEFAYNMYVFWYERKFLTEKNKKSRYRCGNKYMDGKVIVRYIICEDIRIEYEGAKDKLSKNSELIEVDNIDDIIEQYIELKNKLIDSLSEQVREYLNEK